MLRPLFTIARYTLLEALRTRLFLVVLAVLALGFMFALFLKQVAVTDTAAIQAALLAAEFRFCAVLILASFIIVSQVREANDKGLELLLALPVPRAVYLLGKLAGYLACALCAAILFSLPLAPFVPHAGLLSWGLSLFLELSIVAAASLFCVLTLNQVTASLAALGGFYLLARSLAALQLIAQAQSAEAASGTARLMARTLDALALVMPRLDEFTRTGWLLDTLPAPLGHIALQAAIYVLLLSGAALFDMYRRNL